jgi:cytochrome b
MIQVWSKNIRLFHSILIVLIVSAFITEDFEEVHEVIGYSIFLLLLYRLFYGVATTNKYEKISGFFHSPKAIMSFIKSIVKLEEERHLGHNPVAGIVMFLMIVIILVISLTGAFGFAMKDGEGILSLLISSNFQLGELLLDIHEVLTKIVLLFIGLHLSGVVVSSILTKENLLRSIFKDGKKRDI